MSYSSTLKPLYIDPIYNSSKRRAEFRILEGNEEIYTSNMRLLNVGVITSLDGQNSYIYNTIGGAYVLIDRIRLLAGNELIEEIVDFPKWASFKNLNSSNDNNKSINKWVNKSQLGFTTTDGLPATNNELRYNFFYPDKNNFDIDNNNIENCSWLSLRSVFSFLKNTPYLDTNKLQNLRVVIEYNTLSTIVSGDETQFDLNGNFQTAEPLLVVDEVMNKDESVKQPDLIKYMPLELDRVKIPAINATSETGTTQELKMRVNGFNNKTVNRMLLVNSPQSANLNFNRWNSVSQLGQVVQPVINGKQKLPFEGINGPNRRLAMTVDTWGEMNLIDGMAHCGVGSTLNVYDNVLRLIGTGDYTAWVVGEKVENMDLNYKRVNVNETNAQSQTTTKLNQALNLTLYGEVEKVLTVNNGVVKSSYV